LEESFGSHLEALMKIREEERFFDLTESSEDTRAGLVADVQVFWPHLDQDSGRD